MFDKGIVALFAIVGSTAALAQTVEGAPNLFDGIEPIVHLRSYYWDSQSTSDAQSEAWAIHGPWLRERPGDYGQLARRRLMAGAFMGAGDYVHAARRRLPRSRPSWKMSPAPCKGSEPRSAMSVCRRSASSVPSTG